MKYEKGEFKSMIGDSVDIVVHMDKVGDISRKVHSIISVKGYNEEKQDYIIVNECVEGQQPPTACPQSWGRWSNSPCTDYRYRFACIEIVT